MGRFFIVFLMFLSFADAFEIDTTTVVVQKQKEQVSRHIAQELVSYLKKITGGNIVLADEKKLHAGQSAVVLAVEKRDDLGTEGFLLQTKENRLYILSSSTRGLLYGVYYFLDRYLGCKFLSKDFEYVPHYKKKDLGNIDRKQIPRFAYREIFFAEADDLRFSYKNLLNGRLGHRILMQNDLLPKPLPTYTFMSSELMDPQFECDGQYDYKNTQARKNALETLHKKLSAFRDDPQAYVTLEHEDRSSVCTKGLEEGETPVKVFVAYTEYLAKRLRNIYPNDLFFTQAYLWSRRAPENFHKFPPNLGVHFSVIEADFSKPLTSAHNRVILNDLQSWRPYTDKAVIWHYTVNFGGYFFPYPNLYALDEDIKTFAKDTFVKGLFLQGGGVGAELADLRIWVFSRLLWDPDLDMEKQIETFCLYYYGEGADAVQRYIAQVQVFIRESGERLTLKTPVNARFLSTQNLDRLDAILSEGLKKLKPKTPYYEHMMDLFSGLDYIRIMRGEANGKRAHIKKRFRKYLQKHPDMTEIAEGVEIKSIQKIINLHRKRERIPTVVRKTRAAGKKYLSFQEYQLELCCADIVEDKLASDGVSAVMPGSSKEWGFSLPFTNIPDGKWDVYADVRIEKNSDGIFDGLKWALRYGIDPGIIKGIRLSAQFGNGYETIKIGSIKIPEDKHRFVWLSPPGNDAIRHVYVDRIYLVGK